MIKIRSCVLCRNKYSKEDLIRIVNIDGKPFIDKSYKINKRGMYLCNNSNCFKNLINQINKGKFNNKLNFADVNDLIELINGLLLKI